MVEVGVGKEEYVDLSDSHLPQSLADAGVTTVVSRGVACIEKESGLSVSDEESLTPTPGEQRGTDAGPGRSAASTG